MSLGDFHGMLMRSPFVTLDSFGDRREVYRRKNEIVRPLIESEEYLAVEEIELPGVKREDIKVRENRKSLTVNWVKRKGGEEYYFWRKFVAPREKEVSQVKAHLEDGVLSLEVELKDKDDGSREVLLT